MVDIVESDPAIPDELLFGRAGYIYALLFVRKHLGDEVIPGEAFNRVRWHLILTLIVSLFHQKFSF